jgi:hypothetical protein
MSQNPKFPKIQAPSPLKQKNPSSISQGGRYHHPKWKSNTEKRKTNPKTPAISHLHYWIIRYQSSFAIVIEKPSPLFPLPGLSISLSRCVCVCVCISPSISNSFFSTWFEIYRRTIRVHGMAHSKSKSSPQSEQSSGNCGGLGRSISRSEH